jgi:hypothetical protein
MLLDHAIDRVPAASADTHDLHAGVLMTGFFEFEDHRIARRRPGQRPAPNRASRVPRPA